MQEPFIIHKDIICHHSSYFAKAFNGNHVESKTQTMSFPDVHSDTFGLLVEWFYTQKIDIDPQDRDTNLLLLAQLWTLRTALACQRCRIISWIISDHWSSALREKG